MCAGTMYGINLTIINLVACVTAFIFIPNNAPRVQTPVGDVIGKQLAILQDGVNRNVHVFLGIPYAEAPVGNLRFRKPVPKAAFTSPFTATEFGPACLQFKYEGIHRLSEDCLSLNVHVPVTRAPTTLKPVMVWIHGGGFVGGVSSNYQSQELSAFGDVIVVTLNYRLAQMGFLSINSSFIPGNYGLWDQHLAIQWVHDNIAAFGGDVNNITIFGESAGSSSVMYQVLYPGNNGLFQRAIAESGGITSYWAQKDDSKARQNAQHFGKDLGCFTEGIDDDDAMIACMRTLPETKILRIMQDNSYGYDVNNFVWTVAVDGEFVSTNQKDMFKHSVVTAPGLQVFNDIDLLIGINRADGMLDLPEWRDMLHQSDLENLTLSRAQYDNIIVPKYLFVDNKFRDVSQIVKEIVLFTYTDWTNPDDESARLHNLVNFVTDLEFTVPTIVALNARATSTRNSYLYEFAYRPTQSLLPVITRITDESMANHADELNFVFGNPVSENATAEMQSMSRAMMAMWTNFAKTGNPNTPEDIRKYYPITWPLYDNSTQSYLELSHQMSPQSVKQKLNARRVALWTEVLPNIKIN